MFTKFCERMRDDGTYIIYVCTSNIFSISFFRKNIGDLSICIMKKTIWKFLVYRIVLVSGIHVKFTTFCGSMQDDVTSLYSTFNACNLIVSMDQAPRLKNFVHAQLSMKFQLHIKGKMVKNKHYSCFETLRRCIYPANEC